MVNFHNLHDVTQLPSIDEDVRVVCITQDCPNQGREQLYDGNYRQHSIHLCGGCGGELHELEPGESYKPNLKFRRVKLRHPHLAVLKSSDPRLEGLTPEEREAGWEVHPMIGKVSLAELEAAQELIHD